MVAVSCYGETPLKHRQESCPELMVKLYGVKYRWKIANFIGQPQCFSADILYLKRLAAGRAIKGGSMKYWLQMKKIFSFKESFEIKVTFSFHVTIIHYITLFHKISVKYVNGFGCKCDELLKNLMGKCYFFCIFLQ